MSGTERTSGTLIDYSNITFFYHELLVADHVPVVARVGDDAAVEEVVFVERVQNLSDVRVDKRNESEIP